MAAAIIVMGALATPSLAWCPSDCDHDAQVTIRELTVAVLGVIDPAAFITPSCRTAIDADRDGQLAINDLIVAVDRALNGCADTCPALTYSYEDVCRRDAANARCINDVESVLLPGWTLDSDGRFIELEFLGLEPPLIFIAEVLNEQRATITGVRNSRFGIIEPASGNVQLIGGGLLTVYQLDPSLTIDDCRVKELH